MILAAQNNHERCLLALINAGAVIDAADSSGVTSLMQACGRGHEQCALELLKAGARKDATTHKGPTALSLARRNGHDALCRLLE